MIPSFFRPYSPINANMNTGDHAAGMGGIMPDSPAVWPIEIVHQKTKAVPRAIPK